MDVKRLRITAQPPPADATIEADPAEEPLETYVGRCCSFSLLARDRRARRGRLILPHAIVETPCFMPVGTNGPMKMILAERMDKLGPQIMLNNTYHLGARLGKDLLTELGGTHKLMQWNKALLTDSGGFQMVSLLKLARITEEGVVFQHPETSEELMLTPEESMAIQNAIGADVMMALDDVLSAVETSRERFEESVARTTRWMKRCIEAHKRPFDQNLWAIVQGGLHEDLRRESMEQLKQLELPGYAIGGLSGGEEKSKFWRMVELCARPGGLPDNRSRYLMGVGYPLDIVVCVSLGCDLFDCVFPTRTARFGVALTDEGHLRLKNRKYKDDPAPICSDPDICDCYLCSTLNRAFIHATIDDPSTQAMLSEHNIRYLHKLGERMRSAIEKKVFDKFVHTFLEKSFSAAEGQFPPLWVKDALEVTMPAINEWYDWSRLSEAEMEAMRAAEKCGSTPHTEFQPRAAKTLTEENLDVVCRECTAELQAFDLKAVESINDLNESCRDFSDKSDPKIIRQICRTQIKSWAACNITADDIQVDQIMAGLTNQLFAVSCKRDAVLPHKVLFRIYGSSIGDLYDSSFELQVFKMLSTHRAAPKFIAEFEGGRIEEFIDGPPLQVKEMSNPAVVVAVANILSRFHQLNVPEMKEWPAVTTSEAWCFHSIRRWGGKARELYMNRHNETIMDSEGTRSGATPTTEHGSPSVGHSFARKISLLNSAETKSGVQSLETMYMDEMLNELDTIEALCLPEGCDREHPIVKLAFCHNDVQENNILCTGTRLRLIDFEYSNFNCPAFDIANFFCEMTIDYCHHEPPYFEHDTDPAHFPSEELIRLFGSVYLSRVTGESVLPSSGGQLAAFVEIVNRFVLASHLLWGFWSVIRAPQATTTSDFDFLMYAQSRFLAYRRWKAAKQLA